MKPYLQGQLENLCGVYSIVNSVRYVTGFSYAKTADLYNQIVDHLAHDHPKVFARGMHFTRLWRTIQTFCPDLPVRVYRPFFRHKIDCTASYLTSLKAEINDRRACALIGVGEPWNHWTVVERLTPKRIMLLDSSRYYYINTSTVTVDLKTETRNYQIWPRMTVIFAQPD